MKVKFTPNGGSAIDLSEDSYPLSCAVDGPIITSSHITQDDNIVRSAVPSRIPRQNQTMECTFSVSRAHPDLNDAFTFVEDHVRTLGETDGTAEFYDGATLFATWENATVVATSRSLGLTTVTQYRIRGVPA